MAFELASLFLRFSTRGQELVHAANEQLHAGMQAVQQAATAAGEAAKQAFAKAGAATTSLKNQIKQVEAQLKEARLAATGFGNLTGAQMREAAKDVEALERKLAALKGAAGGLGSAGQGGGLDKLRESLGAIGRVGAFAFAGLTASLGGFIRAGIQGTYIGEQLSLQMGFLSRNIAGLFRPELEKLISGLRQVIQWFRGLSEVQRANIARFVEGAAAGLALLAVLPRLISGFTALAGVFKVFTGAAGLTLPLLGQMSAVLIALGGAGMVMQGQWGPLQKMLLAVQQLFQQLVRIVVPVATALATILTPIIQSLADWMRSLGSETIATTVKILAAVSAFSATVSIINKIVTAIQGAVKALRAWTAAEIVAQALSGPKAWVNIAAGIAAAGIAIAAVNRVMAQANDTMAKQQGLRSEMTLTGGGFENINETYKRVQSSALRLTANDDPYLRKQSETNDLLKEIRDKLPDKHGRGGRGAGPGGNAGA